jgi:hypothetical protein
MRPIKLSSLHDRHSANPSKTRRSGGARKMKMEEEDEENEEDSRLENRGCVFYFLCFLFRVK